MAKLIYSAITSLDGYVEDRDGNIDWSAPDQEVHTFINDLERPVGTYLYGRRMYETMVYWETAHTLPDQSPAVQEFVKDMAGCREDFVFQDAAGSIQRQDADRAALRPRGSDADQGDSST